MCDQILGLVLYIHVVACFGIFFDVHVCRVFDFPMHLSRLFGLFSGMDLIELGAALTDGS